MRKTSKINKLLTSNFYISTTKRFQHLDFLRGIAIFLVLLRHSNFSNRLTQFGWLGVDLFFVLSGFLISNLLFREYKSTGTINITRFFVRRALKIFPPFYLFILLSLILNYYNKGHVTPISTILIELFYLQSYFQGISYHTWSLAVEEHFYLVLTFLLYPLMKVIFFLTKPRLAVILSLLLGVCFALRLFYSFPHRNEYVFSFTYTHLRCDGILVGILASYLYEFTNFAALIHQRRLLSISIAALLIIPGFLFHGGSFIMNTIGLTTVNLGFGILCMIGVITEPIKSTQLSRPLFLSYRFICITGVYSYSVYLWHLTVKDYIGLLTLSPTIFFIAYILFSLVIGFLMSVLIEKPFLKLKDRLTISRKTILT